MFSDEVKASFIAQGRGMAAHINQTAAEQYLVACRNWAANHGKGPEPKPALAVEAIFDFTANWSMRLKPTHYAVSDLLPSTLLPKAPTDVNAIGYPVGGPIPGQPGRWYDWSTAGSSVGQKATVNGKQYEYQGITPFNRAWVEVQNVVEN